MKTNILKLITGVCMAIIPLLPLTAQDGNYPLMTKGDRCPFDTAVAVNIPQYRAETMKFDLCDSLITESSLIADNQQKQLATLEGKALNLQELNSTFEKEIGHKALLNERLLKEYEIINSAYAKERTWLKKNSKWIAFGVGMIAGAAAAGYYILN